jgi:hypothetical protein
MPDIPNRDELERQYGKLIGKLLSAYGGRLLEKLGDPPSLDNLPADFWDEEAKELMRGLAPFGERVFMDAAERMMIDAPIGIEWALVNTQALEWARGYTFDLVTGINGTTREAVSSAVQDYFGLGQTIGELEDQLAGVFGPVRAEMIAVTEVTRAAVEGERAIAKDLAEQGIVMTETWNTNNDDLVCEICEPLNGKAKGDGWEESDGPPAHVRCRCWTNHELLKGEAAGEAEYIDLTDRGLDDNINMLQEEFRPWYKSLSDEEKTAIQYYTDGKYGELNRLLRSGSFDPSSFAQSNLTQMVKELDSALAKSQGTPFNMILHRGFWSEDLANSIKNGLLKVGDVIKESQYLSTSTSQAGAFKTGITYLIRAPKGTNGAFIGFETLTGHLSESEFILSRGTSFIINEIHRFTSLGGAPNYVLEVTIKP